MMGSPTRFCSPSASSPQVAEKEENSTFDTAQSIPEPPLVVEGRVSRQ